MNKWGGVINGLSLPPHLVDKVPTGENTFKNFATRKLLIGFFLRRHG